MGGWDEYHACLRKVEQENDPCSASNPISEALATCQAKVSYL